MQTTTLAPPLGAEIVSGHLLVAYTSKPPYDHEQAVGVGLFVRVRPGDEYHQYAVWTLYTSDGTWHAERGDYCPTLHEAVTAYIERGGDIR